MPLLAGLVSSLFTALATFLAKLFLARLAIRIAALAAIGVFGAALMVTFNTVVAPLVASAFNSSYGQFIGLAFPPVAGTCLAGLATLWVACTTYRLQVDATKLTAGL